MLSGFRAGPLRPPRGAPRHDFHPRLSAAGASARAVASAAFLTLVTACGGGGGGGGGMPPPGGPPPFTSGTQGRVLQLSTFSACCDGVPATGTLYTKPAAQPHPAVNPTSPLKPVHALQ